MDDTPANTDDESPDRGYSRRSALQNFGTLAVALTGLQTTDVARADHNGTEWNENEATYGQFESATHEDHYHVRDIHWEAQYKGWDDIGDEISHHFGFGMVSHTFLGYKPSLYDPMEPDAGEQLQDGCKLHIYNSDGTESIDVDSTYPGYVDVGDGTDPNWSNVIQEDTDSMSYYQDRVETEIDEDGGDSTQKKVIAFVAKQALGSVTSGVGSAFSLAQLIFEEYSDNSCGETINRGEPTSFIWDFCNSSGNDNDVPINFMHAEMELRVPDDGTSHTAYVEQEVEQDTYDDSYGSDDSVKWELNLPGYRSSASLSSTSTYKE